MRFLRKLVQRIVIFAVQWCIAVPLAVWGSMFHFGVGVLCRLAEMVGLRQTKRVIRTPDECFEGLDKFGYPFKPNYASDLLWKADLSEQAAAAEQKEQAKALPRVHYVDEGPKDAKHTLLLLHGEPSWSYLYRKMVPPLVKAGHRVVVPDFIGFGKSDKFTQMCDYTHEMHRATLLALIRKLDLTNICLVCQDWGGLTGLSVVKDAPSRFSRLVIMNTGLPTGMTGTELIGLLLGHPFIIWRCAVSAFGHYLPVERLFRMACKLSADESGPYGAPFPSASYRAGAAKWPLLVPIFSFMTVAKDMKQARAFLKTWKKPCALMFSNKDPITRGVHKDFERLIPTAGLNRTIEGAGHFLQETHGKEIGERIVQFIDKEQ